MFSRVNIMMSLSFSKVTVVGIIVWLRLTRYRYYLSKVWGCHYRKIIDFVYI